MRVLVAGGAGYVGSHVLRALVAAGWEAVVLDNLSTGHAAAVARATGGRAELVVGNVGDCELVGTLISRKIDAVVHCAAASLVGESMANPSSTGATTCRRPSAFWTRWCWQAWTRSSSSSAAAWRAGGRLEETHPKSPTSTYGMTKLAIEHMLQSYSAAHSMRCVSLRYFNAAGADEPGDIGEAHNPETHLIPIVLQAALEQRAEVRVFGTDYDTPDGTCVRDYIHVSDLADAHVLALQRMHEMEMSGRAARAEAFNLGSGTGFTVRQVIECAREVVGTEATIRAVDGQRRPGDPAVLVASSERAKSELGWAPRRTSLAEIVQSAWKWHRAHPHGYSG